MNMDISRRSFLLFVGGAAGAAVLSSAGVSRAQGAGVKIRLAGDSDVGEGRPLDESARPGMGRKDR